MPYETIEVTKLTPHIGAEIGGVDLSSPLGNRQFREVHDALMENLVIFFRDQHLTHDQHKDFGRRFGNLAIHPASPTHSQLTPEEQLQTGVTDGYVRLSIGLEHEEDILADLDQALAAA